MSKVGPATCCQRFDGRRAITQCAVVIGEFGGVQRACGRSLDEGGRISRRVQHRVVFSLDSCFAGGASQCGSPPIRDLPAPRFASRLNKVMAQLHRREHNDDCLAVRIIIWGRCSSC